VTVPEPLATTPPDDDAAVAELLTGLLRRTHLSAPSDVAEIVADQARAIGARDVTVYVVDHDATVLVPLPAGGRTAAEPLSIAGTVAGRAFSTTTIRRTAGRATGHERLWLPLIDGTERLGTLAMSFAAPPSERGVAACERYAHLVSMVLVTKSAYGDFFDVARRRRTMTVASELLWSLVPPLVFATDRLVVSGMLEPCYDNGGDALDYAINDGVFHVAVFDAMGHGLAAAGVAAFAVASYRHSRRRGSDLLDTYAAMDAAVGDQYPDERYVTAVIAQLELETGRLTWVSAGHPPPLVIRDARARSLATTPATPLGAPSGGEAARVREESLEPGDLLLLYTDGLTEARRADGELLTLQGLTRFIEQEAAAGQTAPETLRRLRHAILASRAELRDDATALLLEWRRGSEIELLPQTVVDAPA
jgi:hypothetical protein